MARVGERRDAYRDLVGKPEERSSLLTYRSGWEDDISKDRKENDGRSWNGFVRMRIQKDSFLNFLIQSFI